MQYIVEILIIPPFFYLLPILVLKVLFNYALKRDEFLGYTVCSAGCFFCLYYILQSTEYVPFRICVAFVIILTMLFVFAKQSPSHIMIAFATSALLLVVSETLSFLAITHKMNFNAENIEARSQVLQLNLITFVISYVLIYIVYFIKKTQFIQRISKEFTHYALMCLIGLIFVDGAIIVGKMELLALAYEQFVPVLPYLILFLMLTVLCCLIFVVQSFRERAKSEEIAEYQKTMMELYDNTRIFRHNYKNTITILHGHCADNDFQGLKAKIDEIAEDIELTYSDKDYVEILRIENSSLKWLLISKVLHAQKNKIAVNLSISDTLKIELFNNKNLINAIGVILDNAIESAICAEERAIEIAILYEEPDTYMSFKNTYKTCPDINRIFERNYTTKSGHEGIGLYSVKKALSQYTNIYTDVQCDSKYFSIDINLLNSTFEID